MPSSRASSSLYSSPVHHSPVPPKLDLADAHSQLYQTPSTTSASSSLFNTISTSSRKRSRTGGSDKRRSLYDFSAAAAAAHDGDDHLYRSSWLGRDENVSGIEYDHSDIRGELPLAPPIDASVDILSSHTGNTRKRSRQEQQEGAQDKKDVTSSPLPASWGQSVMNAVGKVWSFCWSGAFRGFYAGGGHGYHMSPDSAPQLDYSHRAPSPSQSTSTEKTAVDEATEGTSAYYFKGESTPIPGQYPDDNEIHKNWVVVQTDGPADCFSFGVEAPNPAKRVHRICGTEDLSPTRHRSTAVPRVGKRTSLGGPTTPTRIPVPSSNSKSCSSKKHRDSPVSAETQRFVAQMRRMEREEDANLRRLNRQLEMMIQEGKQALGARFEVDELGMDYN